MKIKKAFDICKKSKNIQTFINHNEQWLTDGRAMYVLSGLPQLTEEFICQIYDINDTQKSKIQFRINRNVPSGINLSDNDINESDTEIMKISLVIDGVGVCIPIITEEGLLFMDRHYLDPLMDVQQSDIIIKLRHSSDGMKYFAVKVGLLLYAVILPIQLTSGFVEELGKIYSAALIADENKKAEKTSIGESK